MWLFIGNVLAATYPVFLHTTMGNNWIHPTWDFTLDITYEDVSVWIDVSTDNLWLYKYDWTTWWTDISASHIDFAWKVINNNHAIYNIKDLDYGKYRYIFSIANKDGNYMKDDFIFYVDRPSLTVASDVRDIWLLQNSFKSLSPEQVVTVQTIGAPYNVVMSKWQELIYISDTISDWDNTKWWGYARSPYNTNIQAQVLSSISSEELNGSPLKSNLNWELYKDTLRFKLWGIADIDRIPWDYEALLKFDIDFTYCPEYASDGTCKEYWKFIVEEAWIRQWEDGKIATSCYTYKYPDTSWYEYLGVIWDGQYWIQPDQSQDPIEVYCDMTTNGWGRTNYVDIQGNYKFQEAIDCWKWDVISNNKLKCFNPNRFWVKALELYNDDWNGSDYFYALDDPNPSVSTTNPAWQYRQCIGHGEYMTIMRANQTPLIDGWDSTYVRLWRDFCKFSRDPAGIAASKNYMNYDPGATFWEPTWANREKKAQDNKIYYREVNLDFTQSDKEIVTYWSWRRYNDGTYAESCNGYKNPSVWYTYAWVIWDGDYTIDSDGTWWEAPFIVTCDMTTDSGGWTRVTQWTASPNSYTFANGMVTWWDELLMTYKRKDDMSKDYAIRIDRMRTKQCWEEYTTAASYIHHLQTGSWWSCNRKSTPWDYNDIKTTKIIEWIYVDDTCINWDGHKRTARNYRWYPHWSTRWNAYFRVSNTTVLMWPTWWWSVRCAGTVQSAKAQWAVDTWVR